MYKIRLTGFLATILLLSGSLAHTAEKETKISNEPANIQLSNATKNGLIDPAKQAIVNGANVNIETIAYSPFILASINDNTEIARLLLSHYAVDVNTKTRSKWTPLMFAITNWSQDIDFINSLIQKGADINATTLNDMTALLLAARSNQIEKIETLLSAGADINHRNCEGKNAYDLAKNTNALELLKNWTSIQKNKLDAIVKKLDEANFLLHDLNEIVSEYVTAPIH